MKFLLTLVAVLSLSFGCVVSNPCSAAFKAACALVPEAEVDVRKVCDAITSTKFVTETCEEWVKANVTPKVESALARITTFLGNTLKLGARPPVEAKPAPDGGAPPSPPPSEPPAPTMPAAVPAK